MMANRWSTMRAIRREAEGRISDWLDEDFGMVVIPDPRPMRTLEEFMQYFPEKIIEAIKKHNKN